MAKSAENLFVAIGYKQNSRLGGELVAEAYELYDKAWGRYPDKKSNYYFKKGLETHLKIRKLLNEKPLSGKLHHCWWKEFGLKRYYLVFFWLCIHHITKFKSFNIFKAIRASWILGMAGLKGHDKRDMSATKKILKNYWEYVISNNIKEKLIY